MQALCGVLQMAIFSKLLFFKNWQLPVQWLLKVHMYYPKELFKITETVT